MKRQLDHKWKQLDHFEASVRKLELVKTSWRNKFAQKQGELDAITAKHTDLASQLASLKTMTRSDSQTEFRASSTRVATLERRLANAQNQLATYDEKMASARAKMAAAETRWDARVKEYESRLKQAEERVKSEKQGGKERAAQLEMQVK
jgi:predicted  nucleic acid-binding Zn-ribbon protein